MMAQAPETLEGWYVLHDLRRIDWRAWQALSREERTTISEETARLLQLQLSVNHSGDGSSALYEIIGHRADLLLLHLRPTMDELLTLEQQVNKSPLAQVSERTYSFFSMTELGRYNVTPGEGDALLNPHIRSRLFQEIPETPYVCFYPMNKRRGEQVNWYDLPIDERQELMRSHGLIGRRYADRVKQMITGSQGLDDWEWGVTLWAEEPLPFKKMIYEMRFDQASSLYAEFGPFYLGRRRTPDQVAEYLLQ